MKPKFLPKFPIFVQDWLSDLRVQQMTAEEEGAYFRLCMFQWVEGGLPADPDVLCKLGRTTGKAEAYPLLVSAFPLCPDGLRRNPKVVEVRTEADAYCAEQARKGRLGGRPKKTRGLAVDNPVISPPTPTPNSSPSENRRARKRAVVVQDPIEVISEFPEFDKPEVRAAAKLYLEVRKPKHGTWTAQGMRIGLRKFKGLPVLAVVRAFEAATEGPWQTIWPDKNGYSHNGNNGNGSTGHRPAPAKTAAYMVYNSPEWKKANGYA